jgi:tRNA(fMet)-specific endonuclease VapC
MPYLIDSNVCIQFLRKPGSPVAHRLLTLNESEVLLCDIVKAELIYGAYRSARVEENLDQVLRFCDLFTSLPFEGRAAEIYGRIRRELEVSGRGIGPHDLMIASIALANDLILVTHNVGEFSRISELKIEDWEA